MENRLNHNLINSPRSAIREFSKLAKATPGCINLTLGEPDFSTPELISLSAKVSLDAGETHYIPNNGSFDLCRDIAAFEREKNGLDYTADEVIVTVGATEGLFTALCGIIEPGDEIIVPTPAFVLYQCIIGACGGKFVPMNTAPSGFQITRKLLDSTVSEKTKAIILNSPNNPTGCILNQDSLAVVAEFAREHDIFVICDEVYRQLVYTKNCPQFSTMYPDLKDRVIVIQSFSKPYAMTGWRVGYLMADLPVKSQLEKLHQYMVVSSVSFIQKACRTALKHDPSPMLDIYRKRRDYVISRLEKMGLDTVKPEGAFYVFPSIEKFGLDSAQFCRRMIKEAGVAVTPGFCFGGEGHIRISYCCSETALKEGLDRIENFLKMLREEK